MKSGFKFLYRGYDCKFTTVGWTIEPVPVGYAWSRFTTPQESEDLRKGSLVPEGQQVETIKLIIDRFLYFRARV